MAPLYHGACQVAHSEPEEAGFAGFNTPHQTSIINSCKAVVQPYFLPPWLPPAPDALIRYGSAPPADVEVAEQSGRRDARDILTRGPVTTCQHAPCCGLERRPLESALRDSRLNECPVLGVVKVVVI